VGSGGGRARAKGAALALGGLDARMERLRRIELEHVHQQIVSLSQPGQRGVELG
jgi:hypothetical protein